MQKLSRVFTMYMCVMYMSCNACAETLLLFYVYEQRLCYVFVVYVIVMHVNRSDKAKIDWFTALCRRVDVQKLNHVFAVCICMLYMSSKCE